MAYDIRLVKIITGEMIIGKFDKDKSALTEVAVLQTVPTQQGVQMMLLPYGYPFDQDFIGEISSKHFLYTYQKYPTDLNDKYIEAISNLSLNSGGLGGLGGGNGFSGLITK